MVNPAIERTPCRAARRRCNLDGQNNVFEDISTKDLKGKPSVKRQKNIKTDTLVKTVDDSLGALRGADSNSSRTDECDKHVKPPSGQARGGGGFLSPELSVSEDSNPKPDALLS